MLEGGPAVAVPSSNKSHVEAHALLLHRRGAGQENKQRAGARDGLQVQYGLNQTCAT